MAGPVSQGHAGNLPPSGRSFQGPQGHGRSRIHGDRGPGRSHCLLSALASPLTAASHLPNAKFTPWAPDSPKARRGRPLPRAALSPGPAHSRAPAQRSSSALVPPAHLACGPSSPRPVPLEPPLCTQLSARSTPAPAVGGPGSPGERSRARSEGARARRGRQVQGGSAAGFRNAGGRRGAEAREPQAEGRRGKTGVPGRAGGRGPVLGGGEPRGFRRGGDRLPPEDEPAVCWAERAGCWGLASGSLKVKVKVGGAGWRPRSGGWKRPPGE